METKRAIGPGGAAPLGAPPAAAAIDPLANAAPNAPRPEPDAIERPSEKRAADRRADVVLFNRMLRGEVPAEETMRAIALSSGWPIRTDTGFLIAFPANPNAKTVELASEANGWKPVAMKREGALWYAQLALPPGEHRPLRYKLVVDGNYQPDRWARYIGYDDHGEYSLTHRPRGAHLERYPLLTDGNVEPRDVRIWVPRGRPTHQLYVQDGQNLFDPQGPHGGWHLNEQVGPHTLAIGIDNTRSRVEEYTHVVDARKGKMCGGGGDKYADFVHLYLRPWIEARYGKPKRTGLLGSSLGGLVSYHIGRRFPDAYDFVGSMSGTFGWGKRKAGNARMLELYLGVAPGRTSYYLDSGGGPGKDNYEVTREFADQLAAQGHEYEKNLVHWHEPNAPHTEAAWAARLRRPLSIFEKL